MTLPLPAGLLNNQVEVFADRHNIDHAYCITGDYRGRLKDAPERIRTAIINDMAMHPDKVAILMANGYEGDALMEKYASCLSGEFDREADIVDGVFLHNEYWDCPVRATCSMDGLVCNPCIVGPNQERLTGRQIQVLKLSAQGYPVKEVGVLLQISPETVKRHVNQLYLKTSLTNKAELTRLAYHKNLISL